MHLFMHQDMEDVEGTEGMARESHKHTTRRRKRLRMLEGTRIQASTNTARRS